MRNGLRLASGLAAAFLALATSAPARGQGFVGGFNNGAGFGGFNGNGFNGGFAMGFSAPMAGGAVGFGGNGFGMNQGFAGNGFGMNQGFVGNGGNGFGAVYAPQTYNNLGGVASMIGQTAGRRQGGPAVPVRRRRR